VVDVPGQEFHRKKDERRDDGFLLD